MIGWGKIVCWVYGIDEIVLVFGVWILDLVLVDICWKVGVIEWEIFIIVSVMDGVVDSCMVVLLFELGVLGVVNLEGI